jgi:hypothetical protein
MRRLALTHFVGLVLLGGAVASACGQPYDASEAIDERDAAPEANAQDAADAVDTAPPTDAGAETTADADPDVAVDAGPCMTCERLVFVTSTLSNGNLGGLAGADMRCNDRAASSTYPAIKKTSFVAWLSAAVAAGQRHVHGTGAYKRPDGLVVAGNYADLTDGVLARPIALDELGNGTIGKVWTGTNPSGSSSSSTCNGWTSTAGIGQTGRAEAFDDPARWTDDGTGPACSELARLYCIER